MGFKKSTQTATETKYEVLEKCGIISTRGSYQLELRYVSWNGKEPKYDIRPWKENEEGEVCGKGITLTGEEMENLQLLLNKIAEN